MKAIREDELFVQSLGHNTLFFKACAVAVGAAFAALAGSLYAHYLGFISPRSFDIFFSIELVTMVIVGGMGNLWGTLFGAAFLTPLPQVLHFFEEYKDVLYGMVLVLILVFVPHGLGGVIGQWYHRRRLGRMTRSAG